MKFARLYFGISAVIFGIVSVLHLLRVMNGWVFVLGPYSVPMFASVCGTLIAGTLSIWALYLARKSAGS